MQNAFFNIIENAIKYNKENGEVKVALNKLTGGKISISVTDTGIGMTDECIPHIFEPFYRADKSRSQHIPGNGLGLSISKTIIEKHGGEILVKNIANSGTKVTVFFPYPY
ncbi:sensor histidine kinase [Paenibacillus larvae]|uniref:histidine kinase n=1 Tax=Paenibacillus larvae subsp. larvae TaxID=147375 RepID=A0A6C0QZB4_9BACL|nr:sensor histidine kinase [Paenibacillus larvae]QHZ53638.1 Two-component sensor histidine kinase YkoG-like protein [Paenibacillus larvae subsp. larvae]